MFCGCGGERFPAFGFGHECGCCRLPISGDGYYKSEFPLVQPGRHHGRFLREFCKEPEKVVVCVKPSCCCEKPVELEVSGMFNELATDNCWILRICADMLQMNSTSDIVLSDVDQAFLMKEWTGAAIKYDQLCAIVDYHRRSGWRHCPDRQIKLAMYFTNKGPKKHEVNVTCLGWLDKCGKILPLPRTTFVPNKRVAGVPPEDEVVI